MRRVFCYFGRHSWERKRNPDLGGAQAEYDVCSRCRKEKDVYGPPPPGHLIGMG